MASNEPRFKLGRVVATPGALQAIEVSGDLPIVLLSRHLHSDPGALDQEDVAANEQAIECGFRILSAYLLVDGTKLWILTEADRSATTLLLPSEY